MDNSLVLRGEIILETGDGQQIARLPLDGTAEEFFDVEKPGDAEIEAEEYLEARFVRAMRCMVRAHIQRLRMEASRGRLDRPFAPYGDWNPPDPEVLAKSETMSAEFHDALIDM